MNESTIGSTQQSTPSRRQAMLRKLSMWGVLAAGIALSVLAWYLAESRSRHDARVKFESMTREVAANLESRILNLGDLLHGLQGLFSASQTVTREEFNQYLNNFRLGYRYPAILSVSYGERVITGQAHKSGAPFGMQPAPRTEVTITPSDTRPKYLVKLYAGPIAGKDIAADAARREHADRARDTGLIVASGAIPMELAAGQNIAAVSLQLAIYKSGAPLSTLGQRRDAYSGLLDLTFSIPALAKEALENESPGDVGLQIYDKGYLGKDPATAAGADLLRLPDGSTAKLSAEVLEDQRYFNIGQRQWQLVFTAPRSHFVSPAGRAFPLALLLGGLTISMLLFALVGSLAGSEQRASELASRITTDLRASEARLGEAQRLTQELIEALPNPIFYKNTDGHYLGVNKAWEAYFGIPRAEFIGKTVHELYPNDRDVAGRLHAMDQQLWAHPGSQVYETVITTRAGARRNAIYYKATYTSADGSVAGLIGTIIDITDRKLAEQRQEMEHAITRVLAEGENPAEASPRIIQTICETMGWQCGARWMWEQRTGMLRCCERWGVDIPEIREFIAAIANSTIQPEPRDSGLVRRTFSSGTPVWIADVTRVEGLVRRAPLVAKAGLHGAFALPLLRGNEVIGVMEFFHRDVREPDTGMIDIAQSIGRQIGQFIHRKETEEHYHAIFDNAAVGITKVDLDGMLTDANQKFSNMLGYTREEILGRHIREFTHPEDYGQGAQWRGRLVDGPMKSMANEKRFLGKTGEVVWALRTMSVVYDNGGNPEYLVSVVEDITERKLAEQRQAMEHTITRVLAEAQNLVEASPRIIQAICETMGWHCGTCWEWDRETGLLRCRVGWGLETQEIRDFIAASVNRSVMPQAGTNQGLVRRTVTTGKPVWVTDITADKSLRRSTLVAKAGLHAFFGFPLVLGNEVLGAMEFFHRDIREPDERLLDIALSIGSQIGQFIQRKRAEENLQFAATHDALTGLPNRHLFSECLAQAMARAHRNRTMLSIMFLDLDHFKHINDTLGHQAGDAVLREVAARLAGCVRKTDVLSRRGGDEFVVLFDDLSDSAGLEAIAGKMLEEMSRPFLLAGRSYFVTVSIGIGVYPSDGDDADTLLRKADTAMYQAKAQGRNAYRFSS